MNAFAVSQSRTNHHVTIDLISISLQNLCSEASLLWLRNYLNEQNIETYASAAGVRATGQRCKTNSKKDTRL